MAVDEVMTENGPNFVSDAFAELLAERRIRAPSAPGRIGPIPTPKQSASTAPSPTSSSTTDEFRSENERRIRLKRWVHDYNCHRHHTAVGGPPASRANNLTRTDI